jgi:hypothetical protein
MLLVTNLFSEVIYKSDQEIQKENKNIINSNINYSYLNPFDYEKGKPFLRKDKKLLKMISIFTKKKSDKINGYYANLFLGDKAGDFKLYKEKLSFDEFNYKVLYFLKYGKIKEAKILLSQYHIFRDSISFHSVLKVVLEEILNNNYSLRYEFLEKHPERLDAMNFLRFFVFDLIGDNTNALHSLELVNNITDKGEILLDEYLKVSKYSFRRNDFLVSWNSAYKGLQLLDKYKYNKKDINRFLEMKKTSQISFHFLFKDFIQKRQQNQAIILKNKQAENNKKSIVSYF